MRKAQTLTRRQMLQAAAALSAAASATRSEAAAATQSPEKAGEREDSYYPAPPRPGVPFLTLPGWVIEHEILVRFDGGPVGKPILHRSVVSNAASHEWLVELPGAKPGKLLIYCPGYRLFAGVLTAEQLAGPQPIHLPLPALPRTRLTGRLLDTTDQPVGGTWLELTHLLVEEMPFFGDIDGMVNTIVLAAEQTDEQGRFELSVPVLEEDAFLSRPTGFLPPPNAKRGETRDVPLELRQRGADRIRPSAGGYVVPAALVARRAYAEPVTLRYRYPGIVHGRVARSYLSRLGLHDEPESYFRYDSKRLFHVALSLKYTIPTESGSYNLDVRPDGGFSQSVPAGTYDVELTVLRNAGSLLEKRVVVQERLVVGEHASILLALR